MERQLALTTKGLTPFSLTLGVHSDYPMMAQHGMLACRNLQPKLKIDLKEGIAAI